ncbi:hypothetical protein BDP81DRAFT_398229 [Colletotrichum phormii]|uniref:Uncharacterized protein n=1 Tax=Colletotrichum phormii TaxID=359342 RepID=A0AAI9ZHI2_9PEZI|nr:uncharacterized protein BDP81DRAFT_398229 [Colletotrichum phormii]KAK1624581.1 hypothetical protein BDP81DRAFT_398229 [Colletotrichum phormii]
MANKSPPSTRKIANGKSMQIWLGSLSSIPGLKFGAGLGDEAFSAEAKTSFLEILCAWCGKHDDTLPSEMGRRIFIATRGTSLIAFALMVANEPNYVFGGNLWDHAMEKLIGIRGKAFCNVPFYGREIAQFMSFLCGARSTYLKGPSSGNPTDVKELKHFLRALDSLREFVRKYNLSADFKAKGLTSYNQQTPVAGASRGTTASKNNNTNTGSVPKNNNTGSAPKNQQADENHLCREVNRLRAENETLRSMLVKSNGENVSLQLDLVKSRSHEAELMIELQHK